MMRDRPATSASRPMGQADRAGAEAGPLARRLMAVAARGSLRGPGEPDLLDPVCDLLRLRPLTNGLIQTHWISLCGDYGVAPVAAAGALAAIGVFDFAGTILSGWLSDRYDNRWLLFGYYGLRGLSLLALPFTDFSLVGLSAFAVFYGLDWVATVPPTVRLTAERFGAEKANLTFGWIFAAQCSERPSLRWGRRLAHRASTYLPALYVAGVACVIAAGLVLTLARPRLRTAAAAAA